MVIVDSNETAVDATDQVFMLESTEGTVIVGDYWRQKGHAGALPSPDQRALQARRNAGCATLPTLVGCLTKKQIRCPS